MIGTPEHFRRLFLYILDRAEQNTLHITVEPPVRDAVQLSAVLVDMFPDVLEEVYYHLCERFHLTIDPRQLPDDDIWTTRTEPYPLRPFKWVSCPKPRYPTYSQSASNYLMAQGPRGRREPYLPPPQYMAAAEATMLLRPKAAPATPAAMMRSRSRSTRTSSTRVAEGVRHRQIQRKQGWNESRRQSSRSPNPCWMHPTATTSRWTITRTRTRSQRTRPSAPARRPH